MPSPTLSNVGIHIQLLPPIFPLLIIAQRCSCQCPPETRKSATAMTNAMMKPALFVLSIRLISLFSTDHFVFKHDSHFMRR